MLNLTAALCRFLRFPGGCYVEGVNMHNAFFWKPSVGALEERPGHWNGPWEYWSTDGEQPHRVLMLLPMLHGPRFRKEKKLAFVSVMRVCVTGLGLYEYMLLSEELNAEPIWVINNGLRWAVVHVPLKRGSGLGFGNGICYRIKREDGQWSLRCIARRDDCLFTATGCARSALLHAATDQEGQRPQQACRFMSADLLCGPRCSHTESVPTAQILPLVQDALDSIEFVTGSEGTKWGALRAAMGHPEPWALNYIGIGNEVRACVHFNTMCRELWGCA